MRTQWFVLSVIVVTLFGLSSTALGSLRDQGQIFGTGGALELETEEWSQSITTNISGQLTKIVIQFHYGVPAQPSALNLSIFEGGNPISGSALFSERLFITNTDLDDSNLFTWDLGSAGLLFNVADVFSFVLQADGVGYNIAGNDPPGYVGGELFKNGMPSTELSDIAFITYVDPVELPGPVAYYPFNGNADDESGNGNHGTVHGATLTADRFGNANGAYSFDGIDDHIHISETNHPKGEVSITYAAWIYLDEDCKIGVIIDVGDGHIVTNKRSCILILSDKRMEYVGENNDIQSGSARVTPNKWTFIAITKSSRDVYFYINGELKAHGTTNIGQNVTNTRMNIGLDLPNEIIGSVEPFCGVIDDIYIYNRDLSEDEIKMLSGIQNPNNGHWYQRFDNTMTWHDAKAHCESMNGYLATITSQQEHEFVYDNLGSVSPNDCWLGGTDEMVEGEWKWITGENWDYNRWKTGEPNNCAGDEQYLMFFTPNSWRVKHRASAGLWNDTATGNNGACGCSGCNELWPMSVLCEWGYDVVFNPDNGHYYQLIEVPGSGLNWYEAKDAAEAMEHKGMQGHLATLTSLEEEEIVVRKFPQIVPNYVWLGATDEEMESDWKWITSEPWSYTNWDPGHGEPNGGTSENCLDYSNGVDKWNDENCDRQLNFYLVEYEHSYLEAEAESGTLSLPMEIINDASASGGQAISVQPGNKSMSNPPASGHAVYTFNVQTAGTYKIKGSVIAPDTAHDSFWVKMDGESWIKWNGIPLGSSWHTAYVHDYDNDNTVVEYDLSIATHTVTVGYREGGTKLDTIELELVQDE